MSTLNLRSLSVEINEIDQRKQLDNYIGHLRRENRVKALRQFYFLVPDCDPIGRLKDIELFVQLVGVKFAEDTTHVLLCQSCNSNAKGLLHIFLKSNVDKKFFEEVKRGYCIHCKALEEIQPGRYFELGPQNFPFFFDDNLVDVEIISKSPYQCAVLSKGEYGLLTFPPRAKKPRCVLPCKNSKSCHHCLLWEYSEGTHKIENSEKPSEVRKKDENDFFESIPKKMNWPPKSCVQAEFRKHARTGYSYPELLTLVPTNEDNLKCKHKNSFDSRDPVNMMWVMSRKIVVYNTDWVENINRIAYYRPTNSDVTKCDCRLVWTGEEYFLLNVNNKGRKGRTTHLVTYNFLLDYTYCFIKTGSTLRGYLAAHNKKIRDQYGADTHELVPFHIFRSAVFLFWGEVLNINPKTGFVCPECGPRPKTLCCDGVAVGMQWEKIKDISDLVLPFNSPEILDAPHYKERMFIKLKKNRDVLKKCMDTENFPNFSKFDFSKEPNMVFVKNACEELKSQGYTTLPHAMSGIFHDLSSNSSTVSLFQVADINLMDQLKENLFCKSSQLIIDQQSLVLQNKCRKVYPVLYERLVKASDMMMSNGRVPSGIKVLYGEIIKFTIQFYKSLHVRDREESYTRRTDGELSTEIFPHFPVIYERPQYEADKRSSRKDKDAWESLCAKLFPEHSKLTPGLFVVTCCCPEKRIYGFKKMVQGESPRIIFDLITTRFEDGYQPNIIYDASCRLKELGLNREPEIFMNMLITSDPLHIPNHTTCNKSFHSNKYEELKPLNKEACEQFNSLLRTIQTSLTYMSYEHYMTAMKIFVAFHNLK